MPKNLQALEALAQSAKEQERQLNTTIIEIHKQSLNQLRNNLMNIYATKLNSLEKSITTELSKIIHQRLRVKNTLLIISYMITTAIISIAPLWYLMSQEIKSLQMWQVPQEMRYEDKNGKFIVNQKDPWTYNNKIADPDQKIIKIRN